MNYCQTRPLLFVVLFTLGLPHGLWSQEDPFAAAVRPTEPRPPAEEQAGFHLPPGFRIGLFAAEPEIQKPMNLAFDARGRLWVSGSTEYPYAAPLDQPGRDSIRILEDRDGDGRADQVTVFADGLNIPIGLYPYRNGCIAYSVPNIWWLEDTDGDDRADRREILYGPLGFERDTHGMSNSLRRGFDGWLYVNHGFANSSIVRGRDGSRVEMHSGNCYRIRTDGSRVEQYTWGQVNPFGLTFDQYGDLYSADCHTKPIMLLLRNGYYDSFGKPHNGLGYVPEVMSHSHGSTAIAGTTCYSGSNFPAAFRGNMFVGNVMTSRVNRDAIERIGSTVKAIEQPDFIVSDDPWFRPVDLQTGPDGALYIADFYNKIIGHVEVPLDHPGRDRFRARIWRVTYVGDESPGSSVEDPVDDLRTATIDKLIDAFSHPNLGVRMRAGDELVDRVGLAAVDALNQTLLSESNLARLHSMWALYRLAELPLRTRLTMADDADEMVRIHAMRLLAETESWTGACWSKAIERLADKSALVRRAAVDALSVHPAPVNLDPLLSLWNSTPDEDVHLRHSIKLALLESIRPTGTLIGWSKLRSSLPAGQSDANGQRMAEVALALPNTESADYVVQFMESSQSLPRDDAGRLLLHAAKYQANSAQFEAITALARDLAVDDLDLQLTLARAIDQGISQRGEVPPPAFQQWTIELASQLLESVHGYDSDWQSLKAGGGVGPAWVLETRPVDGAAPQMFLSSLPLGESYVGVLRSRPFVIPTRLQFLACGQQGHPGRPLRNSNRIYLRLMETHEIVAESLAPRQDSGRAVTWDLSRWAGRSGYLEVVDANPEPSYAWIAIGEFSPPVLQLPRFNPELVTERQVAAAEIARRWQVRALRPTLTELFQSESCDIRARVAAGEALQAIEDKGVAAQALLAVMFDASVDTSRRERMMQLVTTPVQVEDLVEIARTLPLRVQQVMAQRLAEREDGSQLLFELVTRGAVSPRVLQLPGMSDRLAVFQPEAAQKIQELTSQLPEVDKALQSTIDARAKACRELHADAHRGAEIFRKNCAVCHQLGGEGAVIAPQLDGIGTRGIERLAEDILDPNRNVDPLFYASLVIRSDGRLITGLVRRQDEHQITLVDSTGAEQAIAVDEIDELRSIRTSPMPANLAEVLSEQDFSDLVAYLLQQRDPPVTPGEVKPIGAR